MLYFWHYPGNKHDLITYNRWGQPLGAHGRTLPKALVSAGFNGLKQERIEELDLEWGVRPVSIPR
jgi:hypothetical protein